MKILVIVVIFLGVLATFIQGRYTFNSGSGSNKLNLLRLLSGNSNSDPKLKEGVINWLKDQIDPELIKTWYGLSVNDRMCIQRGLILAKEKIEEQNPAEAMEFIDNYCPNAADAADKLYKGLREYAKKMKAWSESFTEDMPESIKVAMEKVNKRAKWLTLAPNKEHKEENLYQIFDAIEEILNAPEEDRQIASNKHAFLAPFLTGNLHDDSLKICAAMKKVAQKETPDNGSKNWLRVLKDDHKKAVEFVNTFKNWVKEVKTELMNYFETRERPENKLPENIDRQFNEEIGVLYDIMYAVYAEPFAPLYELETSVEQEESGEIE